MVLRPRSAGRIVSLSARLAANLYVRLLEPVRDVEDLGRGVQVSEG
jgi:hypothetical protein